MADEKIDYLVGLAKLLLPIDPAAARYCFDAAMSAAGDVDYDTLHALSVTAALATRGRPAMLDDDAVRVALRLAAVHQDAAILLGSADQFPWTDVAVSLSALAPSIALASVARFAELDLTNGSSMLAKTLFQCAADKTLDDTVLAAFLPILGEDGGRLATRLFEHACASGDGRLAEVVANHLLRELCGDRARQPLRSCHWPGLVRPSAISSPPHISRRHFPSISRTMRGTIRRPARRRALGRSTQRCCRLAALMAPHRSGRGSTPSLLLRRACMHRALQSRTACWSRSTTRKRLSISGQRNYGS